MINNTQKIIYPEFKGGIIEPKVKSEVHNNPVLKPPYTQKELEDFNKKNGTNYLTLMRL